MLNPKILAELDFAFSQLPPSYKNKIPEEMFIEASTKKDIDRFNELDPSKPFTNQNLNHETIKILNKIFGKYFM